MPVDPTRYLDGFRGVGGNSFQTKLPDYLTRNAGGRFSFKGGTTNRQVVDTMQSLGLLDDKDYNWFLKWFSESAEQGNELADSSSFLNQAGNLDFSGTDFNSDSMRRVNLLASFLNDEYAETGSFAPNSSFTESYGFKATMPEQVRIGRDADGNLLPSRGTDAARANAAQDAFVSPSEVFESDVFVDPSTLPLREGDEKTYVEEPPPPPPPPKAPAPALPPGPSTTPTVSAPPPVVPNTGFSGSMIPNFGDFTGFMDKARNRRTPDFFDLNEEERKIQQPTDNDSDGRYTPAALENVNLPDFLGGGIFNIDSAAIQKALDEFRASQQASPAAISNVVMEEEEVVEMKDGGEVGEGIASLMGKDNSPPSGKGIESFLMKYETPDAHMSDRKKAAFKRTMDKLMQQQQMPPQGPPGAPPQGMPPQGMPPQGMPPQGMPPGPPPTAPGPMPTMQQGIMPMAG
jgi:hypothetical protein